MIKAIMENIITLQSKVREIGNKTDVYSNPHASLQLFFFFKG